MNNALIALSFKSSLSHAKKEKKHTKENTIITNMVLLLNPSRIIAGKAFNADRAYIPFRIT
jgi:hypothetical protein